MGQRPHKRPSEQDFKDAISGNDGDYKAVAIDLDCSVQSIKNWVMHYDLHEFVASCKAPVSKLGKAVIREDLRDKRDVNTAFRWLSQDVRLLEAQAKLLAAKAAAGEEGETDQQRRENLTKHMNELMEAENGGRSEERSHADGGSAGD